REPLAPLRTGTRGPLGVALPPGLRCGAGHHRLDAGPPPPSAGCPGGLVRVRHYSAPGAWDLPERPAGRCRPLYLPGVPGLGALRRWRLAVRVATPALAVHRGRSCDPRWTGISYMEPDPGLA